MLRVAHNKVSFQQWCKDTKMPVTNFSLAPPKINFSEHGITVKYEST